MINLDVFTFKRNMDFLNSLNSDEAYFPISHDVYFKAVKLMIALNMECYFTQADNNAVDLTVESLKNDLCLNFRINEENILYVLEDIKGVKIHKSIEIEDLNNLLTEINENYDI